MSENANGRVRWTLPDSWRWSTMGQIAEVVGGGTPSTSEAANWHGDVPWITPADLSGYTAKTIAGGARAISEQGLAGSGARMLPAGTVLMSSRAPVGYVAIASNALSTNQGFKSFVPRGELMPDYVYWYLKGSRDLLNEFASGTTFPEVSGRRAAEIPIPIAPLAEQRRIVAAIEEHLSDLDAAVAGLERANANGARYRAAALRRAFADRHDPVEAFGDLIESLRNGISSKPDAEDGLAILRISAVRPMRVDLHDTRFLSDSVDTQRDYVLEEGDLLFTRYNGNPTLVGACGMVGAVGRPTVYPDKLIRARVQRERLDSRYAQIALSTGVSRQFIQSKVKTTAGQAGIAGGDIKKVPIPVPSLQDQRLIADEVERRLTSVTHLHAEIHVQLARATRLRQAILKRAFEGKLVPQDPRDEPAGALLERIHQSTTPGGQANPRGVRRPTRTARR